MAILRSSIRGALAFGVVALACGPVLHAATYYVDSIGGDDAKGGTGESTAWKTVAKVNAQKFLPGDSVLFKRGGLWRDAAGQLLRREGQAHHLRGVWPRRVPALCGANVIVGWAKESGQANVWSVVVDKATPPQRATMGASSTAPARRTSGLTASAGSGRPTSRNCRPRPTGIMTATSCTSTRPTIRPSSTPSPASSCPCGWKASAWTIGHTRSETASTWLSRTCGCARFRRWAIDAINTDSVIIRRCTVEWVGPGNKSGGYANDPVAIGLNHNTANALVEGCLLHDCGCGVYIGTAQPGFAAKGNSVRFNQIYNVRSGINAKVHATGGVFEGNYIHDVETQGIRTVGDEKAGNVIVRNFVTRCGEEGIQLRNRHVVAYNVVSGCRFASVIIIADTGETEDRINGGDFNEIYNNVFCDTPEHVGVSFANPKGTDVKGNVVKNNVFANVFLPIRFSGGIPEGGDGNVFDYNCYWNANPKAPYAKQPGQMALEDWKAKLGWDCALRLRGPEVCSGSAEGCEGFRLAGRLALHRRGDRCGAESGLSRRPGAAWPGAGYRGFRVWFDRHSAGRYLAGHGAGVSQPTGPVGPGRQRGPPGHREAGEGRE